ncbi:MAG TPA: outer membrane beta-barrel domain-containing protein [Kofleriaceae bacterium]|nr:outer membrane beta-barrel domain-containing protein [Kofleriaceae bacterium]
MRTVKGLFILFLGTLSATAFADRRDPLAGQPAIRHMVELRKLRFEFTPQFITSTNQDYRHSFGPGANLQFHITDWIGIGLSGSYHFNSNTPLEDRVRGQLPNQPDSAYAYPGPQPSQSMHDQRILNLNALAAVYASLTPWHGKFALFSSLFFRYDFFINLGLGIVNYTQSGCCSSVGENFPRPGSMDTLPDPNLQDSTQFAGLKIGGMFGVGVHIYFTDWIGLQLELRDYFVRANPGGLDTDGDRILCSGQSGAPRGSSVACNGNNDETLQNHIFFGFGVTFMLPPRAKISR